MTTVYRTRVTHRPATRHIPEYWQVELMTHTEDGVAVAFSGDYFEEEDAQAIMKAWRSDKTRHIIFLSAALTQTAWHHNQGDGE